MSKRYSKIWRVGEPFVIVFGDKRYVGLIVHVTTEPSRITILTPHGSVLRCGLPFGTAKCFASEATQNDLDQLRVCEDDAWEREILPWIPGSWKAREEWD